MARLDKSRRARVAKQLPPLRCSATNTDGNPCEKWANVGATVCYTHGAQAAQVQAAAERRITLAEAILHGDKRHPGEILEDCLHIVDMVLQEIVLEVRDKGGAVTPALLDKLIQAVERAHRLSKVNLDAGIDQRRMRLAEAQAGQLQAIFTRVLAALHLTPEQKALVPAALKREIQGEIAA